MPVIDASAIMNTPEVGATWPERAAGAWRRFGVDVRAGASVESMVEDMDSAGVDVMVFTTTTEAVAKFHRNCPVKLGVEVCRRFPERFRFRVAVDPRQGADELRAFRSIADSTPIVGMTLFPYAINLPPNANVYYPFYAECEARGLAVWTQVGHTAADLPSEPGRPNYLDEVALYFPELRIIGGHIGWPWTEEMLALAWKHEHVYVDTSAHPPRNWPPELIRFAQGRGKGKVLLGTNYPMLSYQRVLGELADLELDDEARRELTGGAAERVYRLSP